MVCGIRWTGCSGDLQIFHKLDDAPLLSEEYHGKIFIEEKVLGGGSAMRLLFKILALPFVMVTGLLYLVCKFLVLISGAVLGILSGIIFLASLVLFFTVGLWADLSWMVIAFLISPYGLPMLAAGLTGMIGSVNCALRDFIFG